MEVGLPTLLRTLWRIEGNFDADTSVSIVTRDGFEICEFTPFDGEWTPEEIARVQLMAHAADMLDALRSVRRIGYRATLYEAPYKLIDCVRIAEDAIISDQKDFGERPAEPTDADKATGRQKKEGEL